MYGCTTADTYIFGIKPKIDVHMNFSCPHLESGKIEKLIYDSKELLLTEKTHLWRIFKIYLRPLVIKNYNSIHIYGRNVNQTVYYTRFTNIESGSLINSNKMYIEYKPELLHDESSLDDRMEKMNDTLLKSKTFQFFSEIFLFTNLVINNLLCKFLADPNLKTTIRKFTFGNWLFEYGLVGFHFC